MPLEVEGHYKTNQPMLIYYEINTANVRLYFQTSIISRPTPRFYRRIGIFYSRMAKTTIRDCPNSIKKVKLKGEECKSGTAIKSEDPRVEAPGSYH